VTPTFLVALLLYGPIAQAIESLPAQRWHELGAIVEACDRTLRAASTRVTIPRRVALGVREMYGLQPRLEQPRGKRALRLLEQPRFRSAFDLLMLRSALGLAPASIAEWWTRLQETDPAHRLEMVDALAKQRSPRSDSGARESAGAVPEPAAGDTGDEAPRSTHRRRRRRRPRGAG
jgi:poly(A) polymerase